MAEVKPGPFKKVIVNARNYPKDINMYWKRGGWLLTMRACCYTDTRRHGFEIELKQFTTSRGRKTINPVVAVPRYTHAVMTTLWLVSRLNAVNGHAMRGEWRKFAARFRWKAINAQLVLSDKDVANLYKAEGGEA